MKPTALRVAGFLALSLAAIGCTDSFDDAVLEGVDPSASGTNEEDFTSANATLLDFEFDGEAIAAAGENLTAKVRAQLLYTVGHFNEVASGPRLNAVSLSNVTSEPLAGGLVRIRYRAKLPVAWNTANKLPTVYTMVLPKRVDAPGQAAFFSNWGPVCADTHGHTLTPANIWYHYRPNRYSCTPTDADFTVRNATVTKSALNTVAKYPEYHRVWEDGALDVVAVFGKYEAGTTTSEDAGIAAYEAFVRTMRTLYPEAATTPASLPESVAAGYPDITFETETDAGRVTVTTLLVDEVATASASFDKRFAELTPGADLIFYGGHAGLGANVRALTKKAQFFPSKYQILFLNGCDTFSYEDDALTATRKLLNPSDPTGSRYLDVMRNAMPAYFHSLPSAAAALLYSLEDRGAPRTYQQIFKLIDPEQVVLVTGEEDNGYTPKLDLGARWAGLEASDTVAYNQTRAYVTDELKPGKYVFELTPEPSAPGGDADLYVRSGSAPTATSTYKCASYKFNSNERCFVTLVKPGKVHLLTRGDKKSSSSSYLVRGFQSLD